MKTQKIADGAYFVPAYSEQTIAWSPFGYTIQGMSFDEITENNEPTQTEEERHPVEAGSPPSPSYPTL